jgi:hypothetical protein
MDKPLTTPYTRFRITTESDDDRPDSLGDERPLAVKRVHEPTRRQLLQSGRTVLREA